MKTLVQTINKFKIYEVVEGRRKFHYVSLSTLNKYNVEIELVQFQSKSLKACVNYVKNN